MKEKININMKKILSVLAIIILIIIAYKFFTKETWLGFYYPNGCLTCQEDYIYSPTFNDRASCLSWATTLKQQRNNPNDTFECGKNCKVPDTKDGFYVCKETVDY